MKEEECKTYIYRCSYCNLGFATPISCEQHEKYCIYKGHNGEKLCPDCHGKKWIPFNPYDGSGGYPCFNCNGTGWVRKSMWD